MKLFWSHDASHDDTHCIATAIVTNICIAVLCILFGDDVQLLTGTSRSWLRMALTFSNWTVEWSQFKGTWVHQRTHLHTTHVPTTYTLTTYSPTIHPWTTHTPTPTHPPRTHPPPTHTPPTHTPPTHTPHLHTHLPHTHHTYTHLHACTYIHAHTWIPTHTNTPTPTHPSTHAHLQNSWIHSCGILHLLHGCSLALLAATENLLCRGAIVWWLWSQRT